MSHRWSTLGADDRAVLAEAGAARRRWLTACVALVLVLTVLSLFIGSSAIPAGEIWAALWGRETTPDARLALTESRIPRTVVALIVGAAMGAAGAVMQGTTRNPLADPGILGVNAGSSLMVVIAIYWLSLTVFSQFIWFALGGAAVASVLVYVIGTRGPRAGSPVTMTLAGAALTILFTSLGGAIVLTDPRRAVIFVRWSIGSLEGVRLEVFWQVLPFLAVGLALAVAAGRLLNALSLGEDVAQSLGQRVALTRVVTLAAVVLTCGAGTAAVGPVGFVGFVVPHLARRICGPDYRWIIALSIPMGAAFLVLADVLGRVVAGDSVIAAGIMTAFLGGPLFIALAQSRRLREL